jgi:hypothetical protein
MDNLESPSFLAQTMHRPAQGLRSEVRVGDLLTVAVAQNCTAGSLSRNDEIASFVGQSMLWICEFYNENQNWNVVRLRGRTRLGDHLTTNFFLLFVIFETPLMMKMY